MLLNDRQLREHIEAGMITPARLNQVRCYQDGERIISYGLSSFGYDAVLGTRFKRSIVTDWDDVVDPLNILKEGYEDVDCSHKHSLLLHPGEMILGHTREVFDLPDDVFALCVGKSTYARCGIIVNVTPLEPGWKGQVTLEIHNASRNPVLIYPNQGICQFLFFKGETPEVSYADRKGKYMNQEGVTLARV